MTRYDPFSYSLPNQLRLSNDDRDGSEAEFNSIYCQNWTPSSSQTAQIKSKVSRLARAFGVPSTEINWIPLENRRGTFFRVGKLDCSFEDLKISLQIERNHRRYWNWFCVHNMFCGGHAIGLQWDLLKETNQLAEEDMKIVRTVLEILQIFWKPKRMWLGENKTFLVARNDISKGSTVTAVTLPPQAPVFFLSVDNPTITSYKEYVFYYRNSSALHLVDDELCNDVSSDALIGVEKNYFSITLTGYELSRADGSSFTDHNVLVSFLLPQTPSQSVLFERDVQFSHVLSIVEVALPLANFKINDPLKLSNLTIEQILQKDNVNKYITLGKYKIAIKTSTKTTTINKLPTLTFAIKEALTVKWKPTSKPNFIPDYPINDPKQILQLILQSKLPLEQTTDAILPQLIEDNKNTIKEGYLLKLDSSSKTTVIGDFGGSINALVEMIEYFGYPNDSHNYIFTGDYFNYRNTTPTGETTNQSLATLLVLLKYNYPNVYLLLGNRDKDFFSESPGPFISKRKLFHEFLDTLPRVILFNSIVYITNGTPPFDFERSEPFSIEDVTKLTKNQFDYFTRCHTPFCKYSLSIPDEVHKLFLKKNSIKVFISSSSRGSNILLHGRSVIMNSAVGGFVSIPINYNREKSVLCGSLIKTIPHKMK